MMYIASVRPPPHPHRIELHNMGTHVCDANANFLEDARAHTHKSFGAQFSLQLKNICRLGSLQIESLVNPSLITMNPIQDSTPAPRKRFPRQLSPLRKVSGGERYSIRIIVWPSTTALLAWLIAVATFSKLELFGECLHKLQFLSFKHGSSHS